MGIKREKSNDGNSDTTPAGNATSIVSWSEEKNILINEMVSMKSENQDITRKLHETNIELASMNTSKQVIGKDMKKQEITLSSKLKESNAQLFQANEKIEASNKIISDLKRENQLLLSKNKQLQTESMQSENENSNSDDGDIFEVGRLLDDKVVAESYYLVRWKGFGAKHDSWERESNLSCPSILKKYKQHKKFHG